MTRRLALAGALAAALAPASARAQEVEQVSPGQPGGVVLLAGIRYRLNPGGTAQLDAGGGHTTNIGSNIGYVRLTGRPAKFASLFFNYVYVATPADPGPAGKVHILRAGGELAGGIGRFQLANQGELELLARVDQPDIRRARDQLRLYFAVPTPADRLELKLFGSEELIFRFGQGLDRDRITAGGRATLDKRWELNLYYLGDRTHAAQPQHRVGYAVAQLTFII